MTEQITVVGGATVKPEDKEVLIQYGEPVTGSPQAIISLHADFTEVPPRDDDKSLTERLNESYDENAEREDEEFFRSTRAYYQRRRNAED
jgi:hypothetical protein